MTAKRYEFWVPPERGYTQDDIEWSVAERLSKPDPDVFGTVKWAASKLQVAPIEILLADMVPDAALPHVLPHAWMQDTDYPSTYADTDTYVDLFRRAGFVSDFKTAVEPTDDFLVYRGVPHARPEGANAIAWTTEIERARYFAHRLDHLTDRERFGDHTHDVRPTIWKATAPRGSVLAMFYTQQEDEVIVSPEALRNLEIVERSDPDPGKHQPTTASDVRGIFDSDDDPEGERNATRP